MGFDIFSSIYNLKETVLLLQEKNKLDKALRLVCSIVERIITEPLCTSQVFGSKILDELCQSIGKSNLKEIIDVRIDSNIEEECKPVFVYIVTRLQKSGGHTRVIEEFIKARPDSRHVILSTELIGRSDTDYLQKGLASKQCIYFEQAPKVNYQKKLSWLQKRLLGIKSEKVYLFNHHQDSVAIAAIQPEMMLDASFYHHGDHHLCLGVYISHIKHIDPHPMGYHNCRKVLGINNIYIPLTVDDNGERAANQPFMSDGKLTTCTAARSNKIEIPYCVNYLQTVPEILKVTGGRHIHIGRLTPWAIFKIRRGLKSHKIDQNRFIYIPWVPSIWKALHEYQVDMYIASFPYGGGLTLIEAMGAGVPVVLHRHIFSRILSGIDLAYQGVFSWRYLDELLHYCSTVNPEDLAEAGRLGRLQYERFHRTEHLKRFLGASAIDYPIPNNLYDTFTVESDEWALWMERQVRMKKIITRAAYRTFKRLRTWLQA